VTVKATVVEALIGLASMLVWMRPDLFTDAAAGTKGYGPRRFLGR
jgi:hypothetical protein